jgi:ATP-dependent NAD(P)H-hydrate dehydratase
MNNSDGSLKRCGGIGDLLTGTLGTFLFWTNQAIAEKPATNQQSENGEITVTHPSIIAAYAGSIFIKECSRRAFNKFHRSILAVDVIEQIPETFYETFDS